MSAGHSEASFNHSCVKPPASGKGSLIKCSGLFFGDSDKEKPRIKVDYSPMPYDSFRSVKSYLKFYESIPDYTDLHHLSNEEFYSHLKSLKITQKQFCEGTGTPNREDDLMLVPPPPEDTHLVRPNRRLEKDEDDKRVGSCCSICCLDSDYCKALNEDALETVDRLKRVSSSKANFLSDNDVGSETSELKKISDYEADRESSTLQVLEKSCRNCLSVRKCKESYLEPDCDQQNWSWSCDCDTPMPSHVRVHPDMGFSNNRYRRDFDSTFYKSLKEKGSTKKNQELVSDLSIPLTSRIPLYDKLMEEKEASQFSPKHCRRRLIHERYAERLRSLVQPFSFTKREESKRLCLMRSNPELTSSSAPTVRFKAKPIPKNLFSNYAYERMREEEYYRAMKKRVRAEEMLKSSSLPPSMALREKKYLSKSLDMIDDDDDCERITRSCRNGYECGGTCSVDVNENNKSIKKKKKKTKSQSAKRHNSTDSLTEASPYQSVLGVTRRNFRSHSAYSNNHRSNLASVLRIEAARNRLQKEVDDKLRESRLKHEATLKARLVRMAPDWKALSYDKEGDLALRLAARRRENQQRQVRHQRLMDSMYKRVYSMPPMFNHDRFNRTAVRQKAVTKSLNSNPVFQIPEEDNNCTCLLKSFRNGDCQL